MTTKIRRKRNLITFAIVFLASGIILGLIEYSLVGDILSSWPRTILAMVIISILQIVYTLFCGKPLYIDKDFATNYFLLDHFQLSYLFIRWVDHTKKRQELNLVVSAEELEEICRSQRALLWTMGRATIPVGDIPGWPSRSFNVSRRMLKRILKDIKSAPGRYVYVELCFSSEQSYYGRLSETWTYLLISRWDMREICQSVLGDGSEACLPSVFGEHIITREQLDKYKYTLTDAYQIIEPQFEQSGKS